MIRAPPYLTRKFVSAPQKGMWRRDSVAPFILPLGIKWRYLQFHLLSAVTSQKAFPVHIKKEAKRV
jgi:hypothetical protein